MEKNDEHFDENEDFHLEQRRREMARQYLIEVANLSMLIVEELRKNPEGLSKDDLAKRFPSFSSGYHRDAIDSAIEDEYIEHVSRDDNVEWYRAIVYDEFDE
jgi:hypothetical protein